MRVPAIKLSYVVLTYDSAALGFSCENGEVRLVGGSSAYDGRVEVCLDNRFTTVCDDRWWGQQEAQVVCRQLNATDGGRESYTYNCDTHANYAYYKTRLLLFPLFVSLVL